MLLCGSFCSSKLLRFWPVGDLAELADGPTGCGEVARGGYLFVWNLNVTMSTVLREAETRTGPNQRRGPRRETR